MRTTVDIPDPVYRRLKSAAAQRGCSVKELVLRGVKAELEGGKPARKAPPVTLPIIDSKRPGWLRLTNQQINESYFPDVNVWLALAYRGHQHHPIAFAWFEEAEEVIFCRFTQLSFLRLLTHPAVMRDEVKTQPEAWKVYDRLAGDARVSFFAESEPQRVEAALRALTANSRFSHRQWPDAYLAAFARGFGG